MNPLTGQLLSRLWDGTPTFPEIEVRLKKECREMSAPEAAVIGRDLLLRRAALETRCFKTAAFLASDGTAGNDGFMDFTDCVAFLPEDRYQRILREPDGLIDDPVSSGFDELYLVTQVCNVFERALLDGQDGEGFLHYLVLGDQEAKVPERLSDMPEDEVKEKLPRLHAKSGHLLRTSRPQRKSSGPGGVTLDDLIP
jgi:hypothetical protein